MKSNQLFEHLPERKTKSETTDLVRSVMQNRRDVKQDVKMTSNVIHRVRQKGAEFHQVFDPTYQYFPIPFEARQIQYGELLDFWIR